MFFYIFLLLFFLLLFFGVVVVVVVSFHLSKLSLYIFCISSENISK